MIVGRASIPPRMASMLNRVRSLSNLCRTSARDSFAKQMRPKVAAVAATTVSGTRSMLGIVRPMNDIAVQVGGANAARDLEAPGGGARAKLEDQGHAKQVAHASQPTLRSADAEREAVPVTSDAERSLSDARGAVSGSS